MGIVQTPQQVASSVKEAAQGLKDYAGDLGGAKCWSRVAAIGSLLTGAVLLVQGKRKAGITASAIGTAFMFLEDPRDAKALWDSVPGYLENGKRFLTRFEDFVNEVSAQGAKLRSFLDKAEM